MIFYLPKRIVNYPELKSHVIRATWVVGGIGSVGLALFNPAMAILFAAGAMLGYGYLLSLFLTAEAPQRRMAGLFSIVRIGIASVLIALLGQFKPLETGVVFCGFLSYKVVLVLEFIRFSIGIQRNSGK